MTDKVIFADLIDAAVFRENFLGDTAAFTDPVNHLTDVFFHTSLDNYVLAMPPQVVSITHPLVAADIGVSISYVAYSALVYFGRSKTKQLLFHHGLGIIPITLVLDTTTYALPTAFPIQKTMSGTAVIGHRSVSITMDTSDIWITDIQAPGNLALPLLTKSYTVYLFKPVARDPTKDNLFLGPNEVDFGQGKFLSDDPRLRLAVTGETPDMLIPKGRMTDIANGAARHFHGDGTFEDISSATVAYTGSFTPAAVMPAVAI